MISSVIVTALEVLVGVVGLTLITYTTAVLMGGHGNPGEEDVMVLQILIGYILLAVSAGVLY